MPFLELPRSSHCSQCRLRRPLSAESNFDYVYVDSQAFTGSNNPGTVLSNGESLEVRFTTDGSVTRQGFMVTWSFQEPVAIPQDPCTTGMTVTDSGPLDGSSYANNADCMWLLECSDAALAPTLTFTEFNTESNFDFLYIYDGDSTSSPQIGSSLSGTSTPSSAVGSGAQMYVRFTSDGSVTRSGFQASMVCGAGAPPPPSGGGGGSGGGDPCSGGATLQDSGSLDGTHGNSAECLWSLSCTDPTATATLDFSSLDTEGNFDFVYIYDGASTSAAQIGEALHGTTTPSQIQATGSELYIRLTSDGSVLGDGFTAALSCVGGSGAGGGPVGDPCSGGATLQDSGSLDGTHGNSAECLWSLSCTDTSRFPRLDFSAFDLENNFDFLNIYDGASTAASQIGEALHGTSTPGAVQATGPEMFLQLTSDGSVVGGGFSATLSCVTGSGTGRRALRMQNDENPTARRHMKIKKIAKAARGAHNQPQLLVLRPHPW